MYSCRFAVSTQASCSLRVLAVHLAKRLKYHLSGVTEKCTDQFVTNGTTPHVYREAMLVVAFNSSMWIMTIP